MRGLLNYTLDLFGFAPAQAPQAKPAPPKKSRKKRPLAPVEHAQTAPEFIAAAGEQSLLPPANFRHPRANREARLGAALVAYEFKRGQRRTIGFMVGPDGLVVSAPKWATLAAVTVALHEKSDWIIRKLGETQQRQQRQAQAQIDWKDGATFAYLGAPVQVVLEPSHAFRGVGAALQADTGDSVRLLHVSLPHSAAPAQIRDAVQAWLMREAQHLFTERLQHFAPQLQVQWRKLSLSNANTRWGSASSSGAIRLNWRLIHTKLAIIDYVVVHELSHLRVMDHSPRFWDTVRAVVPDYAELRGQLKSEAVPRW